MELLTVHIMGTAAMGSRSTDSVVGLDGQLWDLPGCYVADASLFPSAIGRNPQLTIMALSTRVAHRLADALTGVPNSHSNERTKPMKTTQAAAEVSSRHQPTSVDEFFRSGGGLDVAAFAGWLDGLTDEARAAAVAAMNARQQAVLYEAVQGFRPITLEHFVPAGTPSRTQVVHGGKNSMRAFTRFEKRFCQPQAGDARLWGYNEIPPAIRRVAGPGYFVCYALDADEVLIDYCEIPPATLDTWPRLTPNSAGLSRFIYHGTKDTMRGVSAHVSIGRAARNGRAMDNWFVLCRR